MLMYYNVFVFDKVINEIFIMYYIRYFYFHFNNATKYTLFLLFTLAYLLSKKLDII